jgi:Zn-dependent membrane protease YugP
MFGLFDPMYWIIVGPAMLVGLWAQMKVKGAFNKWSQVGASSRMSGAQAASRMLEAAGITDVDVEPVKGFLSDHYDPSAKRLRLSPNVYQSQSVAAMGIACHEAGHAIQHARGYAPLALRTAIVPVVSIGSMMVWPLFIGGMLLQMQQLFLVGVIAFAATVVFQLITLPVEFDASNRAKAQIRTLGIIHSEEEAKGVNSVLDAAAMTYVAALIASLAQLFYFLLRLGVLGGRDD